MTDPHTIRQFSRDDAMPGQDSRPRESIWLISELYFPDDASTGHVVTKIAETLSHEFSVGVICSRPGYDGGDEPFLISERRNGVGVERCAVWNLDKNKVLSRTVRALLVSLVLFLKAMRRIQKGDVVLVVTNPVSLLLLMTLACRLRRAKFLILAHDIFPENTVPAGLLSSDSWILKLLTWMMSIPYALADYVIVIGRDMEELVSRKMGNHQDRIAMITNWADSDEVRPLDREDNPIVVRLGLQQQFIVEFAGNWGRVQGLDHVIEAAQLLSTDSVHFLFVGNGARKDRIERMIREGRIGNITLLGPHPRSAQSVFLNACDVGIVSLVPGMYGLGVPSKVYNIMSAGKPVIAMVDRNSEVGRLVREENIGWVVPPGDAASLARVILDAKSDPRRLFEMGGRARFLAQTRYSFKHIAAAYMNLMQKMVTVG